MIKSKRNLCAFFTSNAPWTATMCTWSLSTPIGSTCFSQNVSTERQSSLMPWTNVNVIFQAANLTHHDVVHANTQKPWHIVHTWHPTSRQSYHDKRGKMMPLALNLAWRDKTKQKHNVIWDVLHSHLSHQAVYCQWGRSWTNRQQYSIENLKMQMSK